MGQRKKGKENEIDGAEKDRGRGCSQLSKKTTEKRRQLEVLEVVIVCVLYIFLQLFVRRIVRETYRERHRERDRNRQRQKQTETETKRMIVIASCFTHHGISRRI